MDFEQYPNEHCIKAPEILSEVNASDELIHAVCSARIRHNGRRKAGAHNGKGAFATDELTGLIGAAALMRPLQSVADMDLKALKKKFKDKRFAAGCSREIIAKGRICSAPSLILC